MVEGVVWGWFCSRKCVARQHGLENISKGLAQRADGHRAWVARQRIASWKDELDILARYRVPQDMAVALFLRVYRRGQVSVHQRRYQARKRAAA